MFLNMFKKSLVLVGLSVFALPSTAALYDRGNGLIYDDVLDITWMQDANFVKTSGYAAANINPDNSDQSFFADGSIGWVAAKTWAAQLNYQGFSDWRLASAKLPSEGGEQETYDPNNGELAHMFFNNLGNQSDPRGGTNYCYTEQAPHYCLKNTSFIDGTSGDTLSFNNLVDMSSYWYGEQASANDAFGFFMPGGFSVTDGKAANRYAWAVRDGDVAPSEVPAPAALWLFGSALVGLASAKRNKIT